MRHYASLVSDIKGLSADSRTVKDGYLFAALPGVQVDGREFIAAAVDKGAVAVLAPVGTDVPDGVRLIEAENVRQDFAHIAAAFYVAQPAMVAAVTGTNGKTSVAHFVKQIWQGLGENAESLGTLDGALTTPDPVALHARLAEMSTQGVSHVVMEASSHGLDQYRVDGVDVSVAAFTNLSRDHLDYHGDMDVYFAAKARLFSEVLGAEGVAVLNADDPYFSTLKEISKMHGARVISYGRAAADIVLKTLKPHTDGQFMTLDVFGEAVELNLPLAGDFQAMNVLCALGVVLAQSHSWNASLKTVLQDLQGVPGRLQRVGGGEMVECDFSVYVDYAHTPDALETVLKALRAHTQGRLHVVFGCGGDRDAGKRPQMGRVAASYADVVYVTDDNPRSEDPAVIRAAVMEGAAGAIEIDGRADAVLKAVQDLNSGDVLVIAGKGHEQGQIVGDRTIPFDDYEAAEAALSALNTELRETNNQNNKEE